MRDGYSNVVRSAWTGVATEYVQRIDEQSVTLEPVLRCVGAAAYVEDRGPAARSPVWDDQLHEYGPDERDDVLLRVTAVRELQTVRIDGHRQDGSRTACDHDQSLEGSQHRSDEFSGADLVAGEHVCGFEDDGERGSVTNANGYDILFTSDAAGRSVGVRARKLQWRYRSDDRLGECCRRYRTPQTR